MADNSLGKKIASELKLTREDVESIFHKKYKNKL